MAELVAVDRALVQALNHAAQPQPLRLLVVLVATALAAGPPGRRCCSPGRPSRRYATATRPA